MINWQAISRWPEPELSRLDGALANLLCAPVFPDRSTINIDECLRILDEWALRVRTETTRLAYLFERNPDTYQYSKARFRMMVLFTVLQRDFGLRCDVNWNDLSHYQFFSRPEHLFVHGVVQCHRGTCSSLPPTFAAVGRRLGYPLKFVTAFQHVFLRWDDPTGEKFNVECTSKGMITHLDIYYQHWPRRLTNDEVRRNHALQSLSRRQELGVYIGNRGHALLENYELPGAVQAYAYAADLYHESASYETSLVHEMQRWEGRLKSLMPRRFPPLTIHHPAREFPNVRVELEQEMRHQLVKEKLLTEPSLVEKWWKPLKHKPANPPADLPAHITAYFTPKPEEKLHFVFAKNLPAWYDSKKVKKA